MACPFLAQRAGSAAAGGVVAASLLTASGICVTVTGGLGTAYAALSEALGLVTGTAGKINLAMEYAKAGLVSRLCCRRDQISIHGLLTLDSVVEGPSCCRPQHRCSYLLASPMPLP